jgi:hypothetical protein
MRTLVAFMAKDQTSDREAIMLEIQRLFSDQLPPIDSKDDFADYSAGKSNDAWNAWSAEVGKRIDPMYGVRMYRRLVIVTESPVLGKGNAGLATSFFNANSEVYHRTPDETTLKKAVRCDITNERSYTNNGQLVFG